MVGLDEMVRYLCKFQATLRPGLGGRLCREVVARHHVITNALVRHHLGAPPHLQAIDP
jgi:hypothetical protein